MDLTVLDDLWPAEDSDWATLRPRRMHPKPAGIPIVMCTGTVRAVSGHLAAIGVQVVTKPFDFDRLVDTIRRALAAAAA